MMSSRTASRRRIQLRPSFIACPMFERDFELVWGYLPVCYCGGPVKGGQYVGWLRPYAPETLHHVACRRLEEAHLRP